MDNHKLKLLTWVVLAIMIVLVAIFFPRAIGLSLWLIPLFFVSRSKWYKNIQAQINISDTARNYGLAGLLIGSILMLALAFCIRAEVIPKHIGILLFIFVPLVIMALTGIIYVTRRKPEKL